ncbi:50S ribosomal protein L18 [Candidatus Ishikawaella capsulata Mpkobe]|uniref:Large ribosomal subunit protein uL18 n=2 Tax=Candidatus Ishikawella capsulata TaxID=168169 RepID=C5WCS1_9ENTR|nr:50S ribosomal protein L18 [Candidatus Ishikawaella capsulata Mpkobe]
MMNLCVLKRRRKSNTMNKKINRIRRASRTHQKLKRLRTVRIVVHRTPRHIYAQIIDPKNAHVIVAASTVEKSVAKQLKYTGNKEAAAIVGKQLAYRALEKGVKYVSFDRSGFQYHGRIQVLAEAARKAGLQF